MRLAEICKAMDVDYDSVRYLLWKFKASWVPKTLGKGDHRQFTYIPALKLAVLVALSNSGAGASVLQAAAKWFETEPVPTAVWEIGDGIAAQDGEHWYCMLSRRRMSEPLVRTYVDVATIRARLRALQPDVDGVNNLMS